MKVTDFIPQVDGSLRVVCSTPRGNLAVNINIDAYGVVRDVDTVDTCLGYANVGRYRTARDLREARIAALAAIADTEYLDY